MYRIVATDLDETLLDSTHHVPLRVREAVALARARGVRLVLATGRPFSSVEGTLGELGMLGAPDEHVLSFNGGVLTRVGDPTPLTTCRLPRERAEALYRFGVERGLSMHVNTLDPVYVYRYLPEERAYVGDRMRVVETSAPDLSPVYGDGHEVVKLLYMSLDMGLLRDARDELARLGLTDGLDVCFSANRYLECNAPGVNKGAGLMALARRLGVDASEVMAVGDSSNDVSMLRAAGLGVAVANASEEALAAADYVCRADNDAGGVAEALERFVLS